MKTSYTSALRRFPRSDGERKWQKFLRAKGYGGEDTEGAETAPSVRQKTAAQTKAPAKAQAMQTAETQKGPSYTPPKAFSYPEFTYGAYTESADVTGARAELEKHTAGKPAEYQSRWQSDLDALMAEIAGRKPFSYDPEEDALYQKYKDEYVHGGRLAMSDAVGKASAMTGGYGNTYAQSVGQQAYQANLQKLGDVVPELYKMALERYTAEDKALNDRYGMISAREKSDYEKYLDSLSAYLEEKDYLTERYESARAEDYGRYTDERDFAYGKYGDEKKSAYDAYEAEREAGYRGYRDSVEDAQRDRDFAESQRQHDEDLAFKKQQYEDKMADKNPNGTDGGVILLDRFLQGAGKNEPDAQTPSVLPEKGDSPAPDRIGGMKLTDSGLRATVNGETQTLWLAGGKYWVWRKDLGRYVEAEGFKSV